MKDIKIETQGVAIIGMALRLPGANTVGEFWASIANGREMLTRFDLEELADLVEPDQLLNSMYVPVRGIVNGVDEFDSEYFGMSPRESEITDPQQRLFLECAVEALEHAGYFQNVDSGRIGVYAGVGSNTYLVNNVYGHPEVVGNVGEMALLLANEKDHVATRTAYRLGLNGPAISVQTSCSTSLVAVHMAAQTLIHGDADIMLAGAASIQFPQETGYLFSPHDIMSPDGHCRTFSSDAHGNVPSGGVAVVVMKRASDAIQAGDHIYAIIRGSAINNDGIRKVGYTAPSVAGQADVIRAAQLNAGTLADTIQYIETHGTGTEIGDVIEVTALTKAFRETTDRVGFCVLGTLKPNIGHTDATAGVAGLIKATLALWHGEIPPSIHCAIPNPELQLEATPFYVNTHLRPWPKGDTPRRAGVSAFGIGGTNAHVILEELSPQKRRQRSISPVLIPISAITQKATETRIEQLVDHISSTPNLDLRDVAVTTQRGRIPKKVRSFAVISDLKEIRFTSFDTPRGTSESRDITFLFTGQATLLPGQANELYETYGVFRNAIDECVSALQPRLSFDLKSFLCEPSQSSSSTADPGDQSLVQCSVFTLQVAIGRLLDSWGIKPKYLVGHSVGEYAAACLSDAMSIADVARLVATRARLMGSISGSMLAVLTDPETAISIAGPKLSLAAINGARSVVMSGSNLDIAEMAANLDALDIEHRLLPMTTPAHSSMLDPVLGEFETEARQCEYRSPRLGIFSTVTGNEVDRNWLSAEYWTSHLRGTVNYAGALEKLFERASRPLLIEIGPGHTLTTLARQTAKAIDIVVATTWPGNINLSSHQTILEAAGTAWVEGCRLDWNEIGPFDGRRIPLPTYPFQRLRHWLEPISFSESPNQLMPQSPIVKDLSGLADQTKTIDQVELRRIVADIWSKILGVQNISDDDSFFALGGQSLHLVRMIAYIRERTGVSIALRSAVSSPTVSGIANLIYRESRQTSK